MANNKSTELAVSPEADGITRLFEAPKWPGATPDLRREFVDGEKKMGAIIAAGGKCGWLDFVVVVVLLLLLVVVVVGEFPIRNSEGNAGK